MESNTHAIFWSNDYKRWLRWFVELLRSASQHSREIDESFLSLLKAIDGDNSTKYGEDPHKLLGQIKLLHTELREVDPQLRLALVEGNLLPKITWIWDGIFTPYRSATICFSPLDSKKITVKFNTGTGRESRFLGMPSLAIEAGEDLRNLESVHKRVLENLSVPSKFVEQFGMAYDAALDAWMDNLLSKAEKEIKEEGRSPY